MKSFIIILLAALGLLFVNTSDGATPSSAPVVAELNRRMIDVVSDTSMGHHEVANTITCLARASITVQQAEQTSVLLRKEVAAAPQEMTKAAYTRAVAEASALGISGSIVTLQKDWQTAETEAEAAAVVLAIREVSQKYTEEVKQRSWVRRWLPDWLGGTTSYAAAKAPKTVKEDDAAAVAAAVAMIQAHPGLLKLVRPQGN